MRPTTTDPRRRPLRQWQPVASLRADKRPSRWDHRDRRTASRWSQQRHLHARRWQPSRRRGHRQRRGGDRPIPAAACQLPRPQQCCPFRTDVTVPAAAASTSTLLARVSRGRPVNTRLPTAQRIKLAARLMFSGRNTPANTPARWRRDLDPATGLALQIYIASAASSTAPVGDLGAGVSRPIAVTSGGHRAT